MTWVSEILAEAEVRYLPFKKRLAMRVYALFDRKLREYGKLATAANDDVIRRALKNEIPGSRSMQEVNSEDFDLYYLGDFSADTGKLVGAEVPVLVDNLQLIIQPGEGNGPLIP